MGQGIDDFPDLGLHGDKGNSDRKVKKTFSFGGDDDDIEEQSQELERKEVEPAAHQLLEAPENPIEQSPKLDGFDQQALLEASEAVLEDPALKALTAISQDRYAQRTGKVPESARVTRGWLDSLEQRLFFLALGDPGHQLMKLLGDHAPSIGQLRAWANGLETMPNILRRLLTIEHLLDRRTLANRRRMPTRSMIQDAIRVLPRTAMVSDILCGFEVTGKERERYPVEEESPSVERSRELLRVVKPGDTPSHRSRQGSALPINKRLQGKGKPMGYRLLKPNSYCYNISAKSVDSSGERRLTPNDAMELLNKAADLEMQHGVYYSLRRPNTTLPWSRDNIEFIPTQMLDEERATHARQAKERG